MAEAQGRHIVPGGLSYNLGLPLDPTSSTTIIDIQTPTTSSR